MAGDDRTAPPAAPPSSAAIFLVLRRMRAPLIVLISTFAVGVAGLMAAPGVDADGNPHRLDAFEAFYFMSYTASTIGYGEIPYPFSPQQRLWVTISIYLTVIAWAYAIGTVLALLQDRGFRTALATQRFVRSVQRLREPFVLVVGFGEAGRLVSRALDDMDRRFVVLDIDPGRIEKLDLVSLRADVPGHAADARNPDELVRAGLMHPRCGGVIALTDDDEANLAIVMSAAVLRPDIRVVARTLTTGIGERMRQFGSPMVVDPFNLFGDELMLAVRRPHSHRLIRWLTGPAGHEPPDLMRVPPDGRWVVCGYGRFGRHLAADLQRGGQRVTVVDVSRTVPAGSEVKLLSGSATDPRTLAAADLGSAVGFAAATGNDTTNLSLIARVRRENPGLFLVARQNRPENAPLFASMGIDSVLVPTRLIAQEVIARIGSPLLWRFVRTARREDDHWAARLLDRLQAACGTARPELWQITMDGRDAPAVAAWLADGGGRLVDLLRDPVDRDRPLDAVVLLVLRGRERFAAPDDEFRLAAGDRLLVAGTPAARRGLDTILSVPTAFQYAVTGTRVANSWVWRRLARTSAPQTSPAGQAPPPGA